MFTRRSRHRYVRPAQDRLEFSVDNLETRLNLAANLYVDFGFGFTGGTLTVSDADMNMAGINGPNVFGASHTLISLDTTVQNQALDYNNDTVVDILDTQALANDIIAAVQRNYEPFDVNVLTAAATSIADIDATMGANDGDSYVLAVGDDPPANPAFGWAIPDLVDTNANGVWDPGETINANDNLAFAFADEMIRSLSATNIDLALGRTVAHEAGHTFGLRHTRATSNNLEGRGVTMGVPVGGDDARVFGTQHHFARFPIALQSDAAVTQNSYDVLNAAVGVQGAAFVSGTGANDTINITRLNATQASVTVQAFDNSNVQIGSTLAYTISTVNGILVEAGFGNDTINIDPALTVMTTVRGGGSTDSISVTGDFDMTLTDATLTSSSGGVTSFIENEGFSLTGGGSGNTLDASAYTLSDTTLSGLGGNDILRGGSMSDTINGGDGDDDLFGNDGGDFLFGDADNDDLNGGTGDDALDGGTQNDIYLFDEPTSGFENDVVKELAGAGTDTLDFTALSSPMISTMLLSTDLATNANRSVTVDQPGEQLNIEFALNVDPLLVLDVAPTIGVPFMPLAYNVDFFDVGTMTTHSAVVDWDDGNIEPAVVTEVNGSGDVDATHAFDSTGSRNIEFAITDSNGNSSMITAPVTIDQFAILPDPKQPGLQALFVGGTGGDDRLIFQELGSGDVRARLNGALLGTFTFDGGVFGFTGTGNDFILLRPNSQKNANFDGGDDNDRLISALGDDMLMGGAGDDKLFGLSGDDMLTGDDGDDLLNAGAGDDILDGGNQNDRLIAGSGHDDLLGGSGDDRLIASCGDDLLDGGNDNDVLIAGLGHDILLGKNGDDLLKGQQGKDLMIGGLGADNLFGLGGRDVLIGGTTLHDNNRTALEAIRDEIMFGPQTIDAMIFNLENGTGLNGPFILDWGVTVFDDGAVDDLRNLLGGNWSIAFAGDNVLFVGGNDRVTNS